MSDRPVMTAARAAKTRLTEPPVLIPAPEREVVPVPSAEVTYITNQGRHHQLKVAPIKGDPEDEELTKVVLMHEPAGVIQFRNWRFQTRFQSVARWLDRRIRDGVVRGISRDRAEMRIRCEHCEETFLNTPMGHDRLARHTLEHHMNELYADVPYEELADAG